MTDVDISRERIERLKAMGIADYIHIALLDKIDALTNERDDAQAEIDRLTDERDAAIKALCEAAKARGQAEGKLAASEVGGIIESWKARAEKAEAEVERLREMLLAERALSDRLCGALEYIDDYCLSYPDLGVLSGVTMPAIQDHEQAALQRKERNE